MNGFEGDSESNSRFASSFDFHFRASTGNTEKGEGHRVLGPELYSRNAASQCVSGGTSLRLGTSVV